MRTTTRRVISSVLAVLLLSTAGLSQVMGPPRVARSVARTDLSADEREFGAAAARREGIELTSGFTATINGEMPVGSLEETVTVSGTSPLVDTVTRRLLRLIPSWCTRSVSARATAP